MMRGSNQATIALRASGHVDLYWNCSKITSTQELFDQKEEPFKYSSIQMNYKSVTMKRHYDTGERRDHLVDLSLEQ